MRPKTPSARGRPPKEAVMDTLAVRLPNGLIREIDAYVEKIKEVWPLLNISRADAIRQLLAAGLAAEQRRFKR